MLGLELRSPNPVLFRLTIFIISSATGVWFKGILTQKSCMEIGKVVWPSHQGAGREEGLGKRAGLVSLNSKTTEHHTHSRNFSDNIQRPVQDSQVWKFIIKS